VGVDSGEAAQAVAKERRMKKIRIGFIVFHVPV